MARALTLAALCAIAAGPGLAKERHNIIDDAWAGPEGHRFSGRLTLIRPTAAATDRGVATLYRNTRLLLTSGETGRVSWRVGPLRWQTRTDDYGYWELDSNQSLSEMLAPGWYDIESTPPASAPAGLLVHDPRNGFGIISDIDDTILISEVPRTRRAVRNTLTLPPEAREAVPGMAALYQSLVRRNPHPEVAPVFYVSAAPRQLSDAVRRFLRLNGFPRGVLQLKEVVPEGGDPLFDQQRYKVKRIASILEAFPTVRFTLMGDDGERDPESFAELRRNYPDQIESIWIRRVHPDPRRARFSNQGDTAELLADHPAALE